MSERTDHVHVFRQQRFQLISWKVNIKTDNSNFVCVLFVKVGGLTKDRFKFILGILIEASAEIKIT